MVIKPTVCYVYAIWPKHQIPASSVENVNRTDNLTYIKLFSSLSLIFNKYFSRFFIFQLAVSQKPTVLVSSW